MSRNKKNLKMQMLEKLDSLNRIGTKKDKEGGGCNRACGVHSISSLRTYRSSICTFADWMKSHHSEVKRMADISTEIVKEYVTERAKTCSNFSISKDISALNKVCQTHKAVIKRIILCLRDSHVGAMPLLGMTLI